MITSRHSLQKEEFCRENVDKKDDQKYPSVVGDEKEIKKK
jgi:hypothetical protein